MQRHQRDDALVVAQVVLLGEQRDLLEELLDRPPSSAVASYSRATPTSSSRFSSRPWASIVRSACERLGVAGLLERLRRAGRRRRRRPRRARAAAPSTDMKRSTALIAAAPSPGTDSGSAATSQTGSPIVFACPPDAPCEVCADAAPRRVHDPRERDRVGRVHEQRQVGERVLDLGALVEARAADDLVADAVADQHVLEHARSGRWSGRRPRSRRATRPRRRAARSPTTTKRASACSSSSSRTWTGSPSPSPVHSVLSLRCRLLEMTALAALRIVCVER